jgi:hypothetical protein
LWKLTCVLFIDYAQNKFPSQLPVLRIHSLIAFPIRLKTYNITIFTYLLAPWSRVLLEKLTGLQLVKKFPAFLWNPKVLYRTHKCLLPVPILSQLHPVPRTPSNFLKIHLNTRIILPSTSGSPQWPLSLRFPHQHPVHNSLLPDTRYMPRQSHSFLFLPPAQYWIRNTDHSVLYYVTFFIPLTLSPL